MSEGPHSYQYEDDYVEVDPEQTAPWGEPNPANYPAAKSSTSESAQIVRGAKLENNSKDQKPYSSNVYDETFVSKHQDSGTAAQEQPRKLKKPNNSAESSPVKTKNPTKLGWVYDNTLGRLAPNEQYETDAMPRPDQRQRAYNDQQRTKSYGNQQPHQNDFQRSLQHLINENDKSHAAKLQQVEEQYNYRIEMLEAQIESQNTIVMEAQEAAKRFVKESKIVAMDDGQIRDKLDGMATHWRSWAKSNAHKDAERLTTTSGEEQVELHNAVRDFLQLGEGGISNSSISSTRGLISPAMILQGMIANLICRELFSNPFLFLGKEEADRDVHGFSWMYRQLVAVKPQDAHIWRSNMLRQLSRGDKSTLCSKSAERAFQEVEQCRKAYHAKLADDFLDSPARILLVSKDGRPSSEQRREVLAMIEEAGALSAILWKQRSLPEVQGLSAFSDKAFSAASKTMRVHESQRSLKETEGLPVGMVVQPAIVAWGNENANNYDMDRVWLKASVWLKGI